MDTVDLSNKTAIVDISNTKGQTKSTTFDFGRAVMLDAVSILFAPGHVGLTGIRITYQGLVILPWNQATGQIRGDNERLKFDIGLYCTGKLVITSINSDTYVHAWQLTLFYHEYVAQGVAALPPPIPLVVAS